MNQLEKKFLLLNFLIYTAIVIFSYFYVDLNLTLSKNQLINTIISSLQNLGYFHRGESTIAYLFLIIASFSFFSLNLYLFNQKKLSAKYLKNSTILNSLILIFGYPFLSYDLFNYIFDAKIIAVYHSNPYLSKPLDFPQDDWLRFMRWTHRYSPYGPLWLLYSVAPFFFGAGKFILAFFSFKLFIGAFHVLNTLLIYKILKEQKSSNAPLFTAFYSMNPLFLIEGVVNSHNDIVLTFFLLLTLYFQTKRKFFYSLLSLTLGSLIKYLNIFLLPSILINLFFKKNINLNKLVIINLFFLIIFTIIFSSTGIPFIPQGSIQVQFQPWYLFWTIPLFSILGSKKLILTGSLICFGSLLRYIPYLYFGNLYTTQTTLFMTQVTVLPLIFAPIYLKILKK